MISLDYKKTPEERDFDHLCTVARANAVTYLGISKKTSGKVSGWLYKKGYPDSVIQEVIRELTEEGTLNDELLGMALIQSRSGKKAESRAALLQRLVRQGVPSETAQLCINTAFSENKNELSDAIELLCLKFHVKIDTMQEWNSDEQLKLMQKCFRFLMNRGYTREISMNAMNKVFKDRLLDD